MGQSGHGKTTSLRTLDPHTTFYINADGKPLPWRGWTQQYSAAAGNYIQTRDASTIRNTLTRIDGMPHIKVAVVDTINAVMIHEEMTRMREKGYDKWLDICQFVYDLLVYAGELRSDLIVVLLFHVAVSVDGEGVDHILTNGRKLEKVHLEFLLTILVYAKSRQVAGHNEYFLEVQANQSTAKTPMGLYDTMEVPNDMGSLCDAVREHQAGDEMPGAPARAITKPTTAESVQDIDTLMGLMEVDGIAIGDLAKLCAGKKWLQDGDLNLEHIKPDVLTLMVKPVNWLKIRMALTPNLKAVKTLMDLSGISNEQLNSYCKAKGWGDEWVDVDAAILSQMVTGDNWEKVSKKAKTL